MVINLKEYHKAYTQISGQWAAISEEWSVDRIKQCEITMNLEHAMRSLHYFLTKSVGSKQKISIMNVLAADFLFTDCDLNKYQSDLYSNYFRA